MGFGLMFIGFFLAYMGAITPIAAFTYVLGVAILLYSLKSLIVENKLFLSSAISYLVLFLVSLAVMALYIFGKDELFIYSLLVSAQTVLLDISAALLLMGICIISKSVELTKLQTNSIVCFGMVCFHIFLTVLGWIANGSFAFSRIGLVAFIVFCLYVIFSLVVIFNSYMRICYEEDVNMEKESGGFGPFDTLNKLFNKVLKKNKDDLDTKGGKK